MMHTATDQIGPGRLADPARLTKEQMLARLLAVVDAAEIESGDSLVIFSGVALAFGECLSRYMAPADALAFLQQEARRMAAAIRPGQPGILQ